jgi:predicted small secreted protein
MVKLQVWMIAAATALTLSSCGTVGGIANGTGEVLEGVASDMRGLGGFVGR